MLDIDAFLHSLCRFIAASSGIEYSATPRGLWRMRAVEADAADPYTAAVVYGGGATSWDPLPPAGIQFRTVGSNERAAVRQAQQVYAALLDAEGRPLQGVSIPGFDPTTDAADGNWKIIGVDLMQMPGSIGADDRGRAQIVFNVQVEAVRVS